MATLIMMIGLYRKLMILGNQKMPFEGPKTWPSGPERPEKKVFGQDPPQSNISL